MDFVRYNDKYYTWLPDYLDYVGNYNLYNYVLTCMLQCIDHMHFISCKVSDHAKLLAAEKHW